MRVVPYLATAEHGLFCHARARAAKPHRHVPGSPLAVERNLLRVAQIDILDGTPVLDISLWMA